MKKNSELQLTDSETEQAVLEKKPTRRKTYVRTVEEALHRAIEREHALHKKTLAAWEKTSYALPPSLAQLLKERAKKPEQRGSEIQFAEQLRELDAHLDLSACIGKLESGDELTEKDRETLSRALEGRGWQKLLTELKTGDTLVSLLVPNDPHVSVKYFNDVVFGPKKTDLIIAYRKEAIARVMESKGLEILGQGYKDAYVKLPQGSPLDIHAMNILVGEVNRLVNERIKKMLDEAQKEETRRKGDEVKLQAIKNLREKLATSDTSYRMTFGIRSVEARGHEGDYTHIERAIVQSMKGAIVAREERSNTICGLDTQKEPTRITEYLKNIRALRETFIGRDTDGTVQDVQEIRNNHGHSFPIMELSSDGTLQMNLELIRDIRKGKFICEENALAHALLSDIKKYIKCINILDVIKPFVHEELKGGSVYGTEETLHAQVASQTAALKRLRDTASLSKKEREEIAKILRSEAKDQTCTSAAEFHEKSLAIQNCTYVSMDVLDVGPLLLQEFDKLLQHVEAGKMTFEQASLIAGDATTEQMRTFRSSIADTYRSMIGSHGRPLILVGGDEAILAMDSAQVSDAFLLALRERTGSRVVKSVVGVGERASADQSDIQRKQEHLMAQQRAEEGVDRAKKIERTLHALQLDIQILPPHLGESYRLQVENLHLQQYAISQQADVSIIIRKDARSLPCDMVEAHIAGIQSNINMQFKKEADRLNRKGYGGVHEKNIRNIVRIHTQCMIALGADKGEEAFEKFLEHYRT